jgi:formylglycine-generating enzyme required for sulfatase activity
MHHLHIFLSSPGDVVRERQLAQEVIDRIQSEDAYSDRIKLSVVAWDKPGAGTPMPAHLEPQEAINRGIKKPSECDVVVVIFWARMGTPLSDNNLKPDGSRYRSGTEHEFLDGLNAALQAGKPAVWVYRRKKAPLVPLDDPERKEKNRQWDLVEEFFGEFRNPDGSYRMYSKGYDEPYEFKDFLDQDLRKFITSSLKPHRLDEGDTPMPSEKSTWDPAKSPYPGLRAFTPDEALIFYGRGRETDELIGKLSNPNNRFIAVVGASGSGKSSLVAAGLLPALEKKAIPGSEDWVILRFTPGEMGDNPFLTLASAFKPIIEKYGHRPGEIAKNLEGDPGKLTQYLAMALQSKPEWAEVLLFIDQFEELFTLIDPKYQQSFVDLLALAVKTGRIRTVLTMRADFYHRCLEWDVLDKLLADGQFTLIAPKIGALHEMINRPAERAGLRIEEGLPERILDDTSTEPGALALMAFALYELWKLAMDDNGVLSHSAYESFNGVHGAIGKRAEDTFKAIKEKEADLDTALARVFRELMEVDDRGVVTRRRAPLKQVAGGAVAEALIDALTVSRLLVTSRGVDQEPMVEVAHEAIFNNWPRLKEWIETRRDDLRLLRQVRIAAAEWAKGHAAHLLWPHERLVFVSKMVERMRPSLSPLEEEFIRPESERLLKETDDAATTHQQRVKLGDRLAEIGDPRPGVGLRPDGLPDIVWCKVPGGEIPRGGMRGTHSINPFYISKYPVTWIQYRSFLESKDGYENIHNWKAPAKREDIPGDQFRRLDNHPAENVSFYDAMAFCRWLTKRLGYEIRLPTHLEWQNAATGGNQDNLYPWGARWDSSRTNTNESGLSRTTAVGLYPQGASQLGPLDMSGNVWEWCLQGPERIHQYDVKAENRRPVRGGCWNDPKNHARCNFYYVFRAHDRNKYLGFRVCCASPIF